MANTLVKDYQVNSRKHTEMVSSTLITFFLALGALAMVIPFVWMVSTSFDNDALFNIPFPPRFYPKLLTLDNYRLAFTNVSMLKYMFNSLLVAVGTILISLLSAIMSGYALSKINFKGRNVILLLALSTMMIPGEVTMTSRFFLFDKLGLADSYWAFWLPASAYVFGTFFAKQYIDSIPDSLRESALIDGAGELRIAFQIYMPLCGALIATLTILLFLGSWNDFLWPLIILSSPEKYTLQLGIALFSYNQGLNEMPAIRMATTVICIIPILILYLFLQRYIVESIALTGLKQ